MTIFSTLLAVAPALVPTPQPSGGGLLAIKVGRAETASKGVIEHAVILVDGGRIIEIGPDLPVERGIPVIDRPEWVVMPGLVSAYTRSGLESTSSSAEVAPETSPLPELLPRHPDYAELLEAGVTTIGVYPPGLGIPGSAAVLRPHGSSLAEMLVKEAAYVKVYFRSNAQSKKTVRDAWAKVDEYDDKVKKAKEKWDKDNDKSKSKSSDKKDEEKKGAEEKKDGEEKKEDKKDEKSKTFVPPEPDAKTKPLVQVRDGKLGLLVTITQASDWLHWLDAIGEREFDYTLRVVMTRELDLFEVKDEIGKKALHVMMEPEITLHPNTMRQRNLPMEFSKAGAKLVLVPRSDSVRDHENWLRHTGELVAAGLDRDAALKAMTLEAAAVLGLDKELGSLEKGKQANMVFFNGDPFEVGTRVQAVMLEGEFVFGEVKE